MMVDYTGLGQAGFTQTFGTHLPISGTRDNQTIMASTVQFFSLETVNSAVDLLNPIRRVLDSNHFILGKEVAGFEDEFACYCGVPHCVSVANGTDALELALRALGVQRGDTVAAAANAGFYGSTAIRLIGAIPLYVDIDPVTLEMSSERLQAALGSKPKAVIVTHLYGQLADIEKMVTTASEAGVPVIEDCAQAHGATRNGRRAGSFGAVGCFSFYPTKNLGALGDGGAVITSDQSTDGRLRQLRQYGWSAKYNVSLPCGRNSRMDEMQAAILRDRLPLLDRWNEERRDIARRYRTAFSGLPITCTHSTGEDYVAHLFVLRVKHRDSFREFMRNQGIITEVHYPIPDHLQSGYASTQEQGSLPVTENACGTVVSLPCYPGLRRESVEQIIRAVSMYCENGGV